MQLYPDQRDAVERLSNGSILYGGVGSGKSVAALAYFHDRICGGDCENLIDPKERIPLYIITTAQKRDLKEWDLDLARFGMSTEPGAPVTMEVHVDSWAKIADYVKIQDAFFIFDEQRVTGKGKWVRSFLKICKKNKWILLSATPGDKWEDYIPVFVANGFYKNRTEFSDQHLVYDRYAKYPKVRAYMNERLLIRERSRILVKMKDRRITKRTYRTVRVSYDAKNYKTIVGQRYNPYLNKPIENVSQYCALQRYASNTGGNRLAALVNLTKQHPRMIIFYNFDYELQDLLTLQEQLPRFKIAQYNGHVHEKVPTGQKWLYFVNYGAGAEGWNCTKTDTLVYYSLPYSYRKYEQAAGRIDRINTKYTDLYYYTLLSSSRIDYKVLDCLKKKRNFNVVDETDNFKRKVRKS